MEAESRATASNGKSHRSSLGEVLRPRLSKHPTRALPRGCALSEIRCAAALHSVQNELRLLAKRRDADSVRGVTTFLHNTSLPSNRYGICVFSTEDASSKQKRRKSTLRPFPRSDNLSEFESGAEPSSEATAPSSKHRSHCQTVRLLVRS